VKKELSAEGHKAHNNNKSPRDSGKKQQISKLQANENKVNVGTRQAAALMGCAMYSLHIAAA
jgi:uncharacterized protein YllA (UPF0747 family)